MGNFTDQLTQFVPGQSVFTWKDTLYSQTAKENGLLGTQYNISSTIETNIKALVTNIMVPLKSALNFKITVAYRSPETNTKVGGAASSQHMYGQAVDIVGVGGVSNRQLYNYIVANLPYDQIIWEKGTAPPNGEPQWVHVSYGPRNRRQQLYTPDGKQYLPFPSAPAADPSKSGQQSAATSTQTETKDEDPTKAPTFQNSFKQINQNTASLEAGDTDVTWGKGQPGDDSDWIGLKEFLIYLGTRYVPQSIFPFVELIPIVAVDPSQNAIAAQEGNLSNGPIPVVRDGKVPSELDQQLKNLPTNQVAFAAGAAASNQASGIADLYSLDPFKEGINSLGQLSESGQLILAERNIGVRAYGQLVLSPSAISGTSSKPGAIGFTSLEVQAGSQSDNGLALITMELKDIQGNKFTDINSPWSFIYDVRPGSIGGDFFFRFGWQIRMPMPHDNDDTASQRFWNHPGWKVFADDIKLAIQNQLRPGHQYITLTQSLNVGPTEEGAEDGNDTADRLALFDEGIEFNNDNGNVTVTRRNLNTKNYVKVSILNPELSVDENGAAIAKLNFRTTGAITRLIPIYYANTTRGIVSKDKQLTLGDLLIAIDDDMNKFGFLLETKEDKAKREEIASQTRLTFRSATQDNKQFPNVFIISPEAGAMTGTIHPDDVPISIPKKLKNQILSREKTDDITLIRWFRQVLQENECELQSAATGSGAGINAAWIIVTTKKISQSARNIKKQQSEISQDPNTQLINFLQTEKDIFSYRFQGSLTESIQVEKTDSPNAMKIAADFAVGDLTTYDTESKDVNAGDVTRPVTAADRQRNLLVVFSQMQNVTISSLCHPWMGPGKRFWVKGMGFYDGEYMCLQVTHKLLGHKFTTDLQGARMLVGDDAEQANAARQEANTNGNSNFSEQVIKQQDESTPTKGKGKEVSPEAPKKPLNKSDYLITYEQLLQISQRKNTKALQEVIDPLNETLKKYNITSYLRICHFLAQVMHESGEFAWYREFASGSAYEGRTDLGNVNPGDGVKYKGRGAIQITGRSNYARLTTDFKYDFTNDPVALEKRSWGTLSAGWFWDRHNLNAVADTDNVRQVTHIINGGYNGLTNREFLLQQAKVVLNPSKGKIQT